MLSLKSLKREYDLPETGPLRQVHPVLWFILRSRVPSRALIRALSSLRSCFDLPLQGSSRALESGCLFSRFLQAAMPLRGVVKAQYWSL